MIKKLLLAALMFVLGTLTLSAQDAQAEMADVLRNNGKIYTVVAVVLIVLTGILVYLFVTDRKLQDLEKRIKK